MPISFSYSERVSVSPVLQLIHEAVNDLVQDGFAVEGEGLFPVHPSDQMLWVELAQEPVGLLVWRKCPDIGVVKVVLGYVEASSRRQGIFRALWKEMLHRLNPDKTILSVTVPVHADNSVAQTVLRKLGVKSDAVTFSIDL